MGVPFGPTPLQGLNLFLLSVWLPKMIDSNTIQFNNTTEFPKSNFFLKLLSNLYANQLTYSLCYHNASTGVVTLGPDFLHFHIMFALRVNHKGQTEGQTILVTKKYNIRNKNIIIVNKNIIALVNIISLFYSFLITF